MNRSVTIALQVVLIAVGLVALAIPVLVVGFSGTASIDPLWTTIRVAALVAFTLLFINILTGVLRPWFNRLARPRLIHQLHQVTGLVAFSVAVAHGTAAFVFGISGYRPGSLWVGPFALALLTVVIVTALTRRRMRSSWRWVHRFNYPIFLAIFVHALLLGSDLAVQPLLRIWFGVLVAGAFIALVFRLAWGPRRGPRSPAASRR